LDEGHERVAPLPDCSEVGLAPRAPSSSPAVRRARARSDAAARALSVAGRPSMSSMTEKTRLRSISSTASLTRVAREGRSSPNFSMRR
jgi:hypothetical protein